MKNVVAVISLTATTAAIGWTFGSGSLTPEASFTLVLAWAGMSWACMQD